MDEDGRVIAVHQPQTVVQHNVHPSVAQDARSPGRDGAGLWCMNGKTFHRDILDEEKPLFADLLGKLLEYSPGRGPMQR
jgi:hypothetical protein